MAVELKTDDDFNQVINESEKVIVKYYADWCGSCRLFSPKFRRLSEDAQYSDVRFIDINAEKSPEARKLAGVTSLPYFATFKSGALISGAATSKEEAVVELIKAI